MINKVIHYIWLGKNKKPKLTELCINSWKRALSSYEIIEWNEDNLNLDELRANCKFLDKCMELKLWAFVSDYLRLWILYNNGGIYLDTDVEIIKPYDDLLDNECFFGYEDDCYISTSVIGAQAHSPFIKKALEFYENEIWNVDFINNPIIFKHIIDNSPELNNCFTIYPTDFFSPYVPNQEYTDCIESKNTYSIHWYTQNWNMSRKGYIFIHTKHIKNPIKKLLVSSRKFFGFYKRKYKKRID